MSYGGLAIIQHPPLIIAACEKAHSELKHLAFIDAPKGQPEFDEIVFPSNEAVSVHD